MAALHYQSNEIMKNGMHSLRKSQHRHLVKMTSQKLAIAMNRVVNRWTEDGFTVHQPVALQLLFDSRYLSAATDSIIDAEIQELQNTLEQLVSLKKFKPCFYIFQIDPFDLAVLAPNITKNAAKALVKVKEIELEACYHH